MLYYLSKNSHPGSQIYRSAQVWEEGHLSECCQVFLFDTGPIQHERSGGRLSLLPFSASKISDIITDTG